MVDPIVDVDEDDALASAEFEAMYPADINFTTSKQASGAGKKGGEKRKVSAARGSGYIDDDEQEDSSTQLDSQALMQQSGPDGWLYGDRPMNADTGNGKKRAKKVKVGDVTSMALDMEKDGTMKVMAKLNSKERHLLKGVAEQLSHQEVDNLLESYP